MKVFTGGLIAGLILYIVPGLHSGPACLIAGMLATLLLLQLGPRSVVEKVGAVMTAALVAWVAGPRAASGQSMLWHLLGWFAAAIALSFHLRPRTE
jgi:hypothetical protein